MKYRHTVSKVNIPKFMVPWFVWAGRTTYFEKGAYSSLERYTWNQKKERIDVDFTFRQGSFSDRTWSDPLNAT